MREHRGLIPIEALVSYFAVLKLDDTHESELGSSTRGSQTGEHPVHADRMSKADHELLDDPIRAEDLRQRSEFPFRRDIWQELIGIELAHSDPTRPAVAQGMHVRIFCHRREGCVSIFEHELGVGVLLPSGQHSLLVGCRVTHRKFLYLMLAASVGRNVTIRPAPTVGAGSMGLLRLRRHLNHGRQCTMRKVRNPMLKGPSPEGAGRTGLRR